MATTALLNQEICKPTGAVLAAPSTTAILAAFLPTGLRQSLLGSIVQQPRYYCATGCALSLVITDAGSAISSATLYVVGTDMFGRDLTETIYTNTAGSATYSGTKPFHTITEIWATGVGFSGAMRISVGVIGVLGLPQIITAQSDIIGARIDAAEEVIATVISVANNTITPSVAPNGAERIYVDYLVVNT